MHSIRIVPLPGDPRYYNSYLVKVRAVVGSVNYGVFVPGKPPVESGGDGTPRRDLNTNIIFDYDERPEDIPEIQWNTLSRYVFNALFLGCPDHKKDLFSRVPIDDGKKAVEAIRGALGTIAQQKASFSRAITANLESFQEMCQYQAWFGELVEIHTHYNLIHKLADEDKWSSEKLREDFSNGIGRLFPDIATIASAQPMLSLDKLHQLVVERLERAGIAGLAAVKPSGESETPTVANFGCDGSWGHWHGNQGSSCQHYDNYFGPSSGYQYGDYGSNHGEYDSYCSFRPDGDHSLWSGNWRPRKHTPFHPGSDAGVVKGTGKGPGSGKSKGKGKGFGAGKGKGKGGRGFARYTVSVLMTDMYTGEEFVNPRGEADSYGNILVPSTDAQAAQFSLFGAATPSTTTNTPQTGKSTDPADEVQPAGQWWTLK
jgi:hypothetical protein